MMAAEASLEREKTPYRLPSAAPLPAGLGLPVAQSHRRRERRRSGCSGESSFGLRAYQGKCASGS